MGDVKYWDPKEGHNCHTKEGQGKQTHIQIHLWQSTNERVGGWLVYDLGQKTGRGGGGGYKGQIRKPHTDKRTALNHGERQGGWYPGGATRTGPDATPPPQAIYQNWGGGQLGGGLAGGRGGGLAGGCGGGLVGGDGGGGLG